MGTSHVSSPQKSNCYFAQLGNNAFFATESIFLLVCWCLSFRVFFNCYFDNTVPLCAICTSVQCKCCTGVGSNRRNPSFPVLEERWTCSPVHSHEWSSVSESDELCRDSLPQSRGRTAAEPTAIAHSNGKDLGAGTSRLLLGAGNFRRRILTFLQVCESGWERDCKGLTAKCCQQGNTWVSCHGTRPFCSELQQHHLSDVRFAVSVIYCCSSDTAAWQ